MSAHAGRIALLTGASRGIGRAAALQLAQQGAHVVCVARAQRALEALDDEIKAAGGQATLVPVDVKDYDALDRLGAALHERFGRLDALVSCAGVLGPLTPTFHATQRVMDEVFAVNVFANQRLIRSLHPLLRASDAGRAVFASSGVARNPRAFWGPYAASKAALETLVRIYAEEIAITPVRANLFNPGPTRTAMRAKAFPGEDPASLPAPEVVAEAMIALVGPEETRNGELISFQ